MRLAILAALVALFVPALTQSSPVGIWLGSLDVSGIRLRIVFHIEKEGDTYTAKLDSPDQGVSGIPVQKTTFANGTLKLEMPNLMAEFEGKMSEDGSEIVGVFRQAGTEIPLRLRKTDKIEEPKRPQHPNPPFPYNAVEVEFENSKDGHKLAGTLTIPEGEGPFPAVVLVSGSGPQDRDETLMGHKPFWVIADHLSRNGVAVLRYDDRGVGKSGGNFATATTEDFTYDALAAIDFLATREEIDSSKIGIAGHSEGGLIAPKAAIRSTNVAFIVLLAGPGVPGADILRLQQRLIMKASGVSDADIEEQTKLWDKIVERFKTLKEGEDASELKQIVDAHFVGEDEATVSARAQWNTQMDALLTPWFRYFLTFDPRDALRKVTVPVLAVNGELDLQVDPKQNLPEIERALREGGNKDITIKEFAKLNHLFQTASTGLPSEYGQIEETFSTDVLKMITDWILERFGK
ncbi:MAG: alpha/beta fold hydrolase [Fimbriimonadales bacterium]|nr:alpha/beta fold hydrolase [Fimbriimonadales bacterium]